jgi:DNA adenine methylase
MKRYISPLRYPGGKARFSPFLADLVRAQPVRPRYYAEPFAGGAGAAVTLLAQEVVNTVFINDLSPGVAAFWRAVFTHTDMLACQVEAATINLQQWRRQREVFTNPDSCDDLTLGYATFFLNRCNRSGILGARPIGGLKQDGKWKLDARFNRQELADRIRYLGGFRRRVEVSQQDGRVFLNSISHLGKTVLAYVDPPYLGQGDDLYLDRLSYDDHKELSGQLKEAGYPWMLTYDVNDQIANDLYQGLRIARFDIAHTAQRQHLGHEMMVFSPEIAVNSIQVLNKANATWFDDQQDCLR